MARGRFLTERNRAELRDVLFCWCSSALLEVVLAWLHHLLCHVIEEVPAAVGKGGLEEGQGDLPHRGVLLEFEGHARHQGVVVAWRRTRGERFWLFLSVFCFSQFYPNWNASYTPEGRRFTSEDLNEAHHDDERQSQKLPNGENVLDPRRPAHTGAVHPGQEHWKHTRKKPLCYLTEGDCFTFEWNWRFYSIQSSKTFSDTS